MNEKLKCLAAIVITLAAIHFIHSSSFVLLLLLVVWLFLFRPLTKAELWMFGIASIFFVAQNYAVLKSGGFSFRHQDFLMMPYYEPFLWGFYFLNIKRFIGEAPKSADFNKKAVLGLVITGLCFSLFSQKSSTLLLATIVSTFLLFVLFHELGDVMYSGYALFLGFIVELFGVSTGLWSYPEPDILGIPYWFITMWLSVGILGRRFLIPLSELCAESYTK